MHPVVAPSRSSHTRSVLARFLVRLSGNGILTEVTRFMTLRTSSRSAAFAGERIVTRRPARRRDHANFGIGETPEASRGHLAWRGIGQASTRYRLRGFDARQKKARARLVSHARPNCNR